MIFICKLQQNSKFWILGILTLLFLFEGVASYDADAVEDISGYSVSSITVEGLNGMERDYFLELLDLNPGTKLTPERIRNGVARVFQKGIFLDIRVEALELNSVTDEASLLIAVTEKQRVASIKIKGDDVVSSKDILKVSGLFRGMEFRTNLNAKVERKVLTLLARRGFPEARAGITAKSSNRPNFVDVTLTVNEGNAERIKSIQIEGSSKYLSRAESLLRLSALNRFDRLVLEEDIQKIKQDMKQRGYYRAKLPEWRFDDEEGTLLIRIDSGPRYEIRFEGNKSVSKGELKAEFSFEELEEDPEKGTLEEAAWRFTALYHRKGYPFVQVAASFEEKKNITTMVFYIFEGPNVLVKSIRFNGTSISDERLKAVMDYYEDKPYDETRLQKAVVRMISFYNALGYLEAKVIDVKKDFDTFPDSVIINISINEGESTLIQKIMVAGNSVFRDLELLDQIAIKPGDPYNEIDIADARYRLLEKYNQNGYLNTSVQVVQNFSNDMKSAQLEFVVHEGRGFRFGKVIISGNARTRDAIIRKELNLPEGDSYDYRRALAGKQALHKMGLFSSVSVTPLEGLESDQQDVLVQVREGHFGSVDLGAGYSDYEKARGFIEVSHRNLAGLNRRISLRGEFSSVERRYILKYDDPWLLLDYKLPFRAALIKEYLRALDADTWELRYESNRTSLLVGIDHVFSDRVKGSLDYEYSFLDIFNVRQGEALTRQDVGTRSVSSISPSVVRDTRNNPFNPKHGSINAVVVKLANQILLSESEFIKATFQSSWYFQMARSLVAALSFKGGAAQGMGESDTLPIEERFLLGGGVSVRGYDRDKLGPKVNGIPTGGNSFLLLNTELRLDVWKGLGTVAFIDGGNVWLKAPETDPFDLKYSWGFGLRYNTPVGPLSLDYGRKFDPEKNEGPFEIHFNLGHAF